MGTTQSLCLAQKPRTINIGDGDGVVWFEECIRADPIRDLLTEHAEDQDWYNRGRDIHLSNHAFLFLGTDRTLLFDTLSPAIRDPMIDQLDEALDGRDLDFIVVSHDEAPHAGNTYEILDKHPEATLLGAGAGSPVDELHHLEDAGRVEYGETVDLGGYVVEFAEPVFVDSPATVWLFERSARALFTVDMFGYPHYATDCVRFEDEMETDLSVKQMVQHKGRTLQWLEFADPEKIEDGLRDRMETYRPSVIIPSHGHPIRTDIDDAVEVALGAAKAVREGGAMAHLFQVENELREIEAGD